jgi:hypothetical protein
MRRFGVSALLLAFALLAACSDTAAGAGATGTATSGAESAGTATTAASPTVAVAATTCAQALPGAGTATAGAGFSDLPLPPGATGLAPVKTLGGGDGQFTLYDIALCSSASSAAAIGSFFGTLPSSGWVHSDWFPMDAEAESACGTPPCWARDTRYVTLTQVNDLGGGIVTYHLLVAASPPAPDCSAGYNGMAFTDGYYYFLFSQPPYPGITDGYDHIALPPLTKLVFDVAAGNHYAALCSAGSAAMVKAFLDKHLRAVGWVAQGNGLYAYANKYAIAIEDGDGAAVKAILHWPDPQNIGP